MDIYDNIVNFLKMENTGALLIVGAWGSGKTYYLDNVVFKKLKKSNNHYQCIRVSLFGVKETKEIPYRVFQAYTDATVTDKSNGIIKYEKIRGWAKGIYHSIPKLKEIVDLSPLFTQGNAAYSFVPKDTIICFDDIERATETLDINEILGAVNELVENRHFKVLLVANKEYIDSKLQAKQQPSDKEGEIEQTSKKADTERELFYEKVVEKTIAYEPDILAIYCKLIEDYNDQVFIAFMKQPEQQDIVDPAKIRSKKYQRQLQNIRTLKFAIVHFYQIWKQSDLVDISDHQSLAYKKLHNYWLFTHAVAIEQKAEHLQYDDDKGLSQAVNVAEKIYWGEEDNKEFYDEDGKDDKPQIDSEFVMKFKKRHFESFSEIFVFYQSIYDFLTASKPLDMSSVEAKANATFSVRDGVIHPANEILNTLLTKGFWKFTNEEAPKKMEVLFNAVDKGELSDYVAYYNAGVFLFNLKKLIGKTEGEIKTAMLNGIRIYSRRMPEVGILTKTQIQCLPAKEETTRWMKQEMQKALDERIEIEQEKSVAELEQQFMTNMAQFTQNFLIVSNNTPTYFQVPILGKINSEKIKSRIVTLEPDEVMQLYNFVNFRYLISDCRVYVSELPFLRSISESVQTLDFENSLLSNHIVEKFFKPTLDKAIARMQAI